MEDFFQSPALPSLDLAVLKSTSPPMVTNPLNSGAIRSGAFASD